MSVALAYSPKPEKPSTRLQAKLRVGGVNDREEKEADAVADKVMRMPMCGNPKASTISMMPAISRKCTDCEKEEKVNRKEEEEKVSRKEQEEEVQRKEEEKEPIQRKASVATKDEQPGTEELKIQTKGAALPNGGFASSKLSSSIQSTRGGGSPLPRSVSSEMGSKIGADFSNVKVHTGSYAQNFNKGLGARAFTVGKDIYFNSGEYNPHSNNGKSLLAHELTHTVQQGAVARRETNNAAPVTQEKEPVVQRGVGDWLADQAWSIAESVASPEFVQMLREINDKGIFGFLREKLTGALSSIFNRFPNVGEAVTFLRTAFITMYQAVQPIITALANGDCAPLFAALNQLKTYLTTLATTAWDKLVEFVRPIGDFFSGLWASYGAPVMDWLRNTAGEVWTWLQNLGTRIWNWTQPIRDYGAAAWNWVKGKLGIGNNEAGEANENGVVQWLGNKVGEVWTGIKDTLRPVIEPVQQVAQKVLDILPLRAITNLSETIQGWMANVNSMATAMGDNGAEVAAQQATLRDTILPAVIQTVDTFKTRLNEAGAWLSETVGGFATRIVSFIDGLSTNTWLSFASSLLSWLRDSVNNLTDWVQNTVINLFDSIGRGLQYLVSFIQPILNMLQRLVDTVTNLMSRLGDFILGPLRLIPECILNPIKTFIIEQILARIPLFQQLLQVREAWTRLQTVAMTILYQVFVDGNIAGAIWTFFREMCSILGIPPDLIVDLLRNASQAIMDILRNPVQFFLNLLEGLKQGFIRFFDNILTHLVGGVADWLFGQMEGMGITRPTDLSFSSIFTFILQILGLSVDHIFELLARRIGPERAAQLRRALEVATGVWQFIRDVVERGPAAIWERISQFLDNLWSGVIDAVVNFISTRIIARATQWLLSLLDITGIMPVINSIIAIYNAIQSFVEYFVPMLRIVNSYFQMLGNIAQGNLGPAAEFLEGLLARSIPIIIGFLANQFGFNRIGEHIRGAITNVRERIDNAILRIIDGAIRAGSAILNGLRRGVAAVRDWWRARKEFREGGEPHSLYFQGSGPGAQLILASEPQHIGGWITRRQNELQTAGQLDDAKRAALRTMRTLSEEMRAITNRASTDPNPRTAEQIMNDMAAQIVIIGVSASAATHPVPRMAFSAGFNDTPARSNRNVRFLYRDRNNHDDGSRPNASRNLVKAFKKLEPLGLATGSSRWIRAHLLNDNLGGKATDSNLVPLPGGENTRMESSFESGMKDAYDERISASDPRPKNVLWEDITITPDTDPDFVSSFTVTWGYMNWDATANRWIKNTSPQGNFTPSINIGLPAPVGPGSLSISGLRSGTISDSQVTAYSIQSTLYRNLVQAILTAPSGTALGNFIQLQAFINTNWATDTRRKNNYLRNAQSAETAGRIVY